MKSKEFLKIGLIIIGLIILVAVLNYIGVLVVLNEPLNTLVAGSPNKNCNVDSDCVVRGTSCHPCDCGDAVNKNWYPSCPFPDTSKYFCKMCESPVNDFQVKCIENRCQKVWTESYKLRQKELACMNSGGTIKTSLCCKSASDFPNSCLIGACGCAPGSSHEVKICDCPEGKCFDGSKCVSR